MKSIILPNMDDWEIFPREAAAVAMVAQEQGLARLTMSYDELYNNAHEIIKRSRDLTQMMMEQNFIPTRAGEIGFRAGNLTVRLKLRTR